MREEERAAAQEGRAAPPAAAAAAIAAAAGEDGGPDAWNGATWVGVAPPPPNPRPTPVETARGVLRAICFVLLTVALIPPFFVMRALGGRHRVAALWCRAALALCGIRLRRVGRPIPVGGRADAHGGGVLLANHASWLDIAAIAASAPVHFVAKAEIAGWPIFGWIGAINDTVFIERKRSEAKAQEARLVARAARGDLLCVFPEGTSSDGLRVLPFKSSLFSMFYLDPSETGAPAPLAQPVSLHYAPRPGLPPSFFGWWARMPLFAHIWDVVRLSSGGVVTVTFHEPLDPAEFADRKALAQAARARVIEGRAAAGAGAAPGGGDAQAAMSA
ncbi:MAG: lysophospholipid acyltransferase family protein [Pseudomonadota bacterium]